MQNVPDQVDQLSPSSRSDSSDTQVLVKPSRTPTLGQGSQMLKKRSPRRWRWVLLTAAVLTVVGAGGVLLRSPKPRTDSAQTTPVKLQDFTVLIEASGSVIPISTVNVSPTVSGQLAALCVDQGDVVKAGDILARMDSDNLEADLAQVQAQLTQAEAEYELVRNGSRSEEIDRARAQVASAQAEADLSAEQAERYTALLQEGAIAQEQLDERISEDRRARASLEEAQKQLQELLSGSRPEEVKQAEGQLAAARAQVESAQTQLEDTVIRAPFGDVVTQKYATVGAIVTPTTSASSTASATSTSILAIASGLEVRADVLESDITHIRVGQSVEIMADSYPNRTFEGRVRLIAPEAVVENNVTSFQVRVELVTGKPELLSGMNVDITFLGDAIEDALVVPTVAIATQNGQLGVMVAGQGETKFKPVTVGLTQDGQTQILTGLELGEQVLIDFPEGRTPDPAGGGNPEPI